MRLDAHQHFWTYDAGEYPWIDPLSMDGLRRDFGPQDLAPHLERHGLDGCVAVQARQHEGENAYLLGLADAHPAVMGVVGWVDLCAAGVDQSLERWAAHPRFRGVRHIAQAEASGFLLQPGFIRGVSRLARCGLSYDILIVEAQLPEATSFVDQFRDDTPFVVDHLAKPRIREGTIDPWRARIRDLARRPNVLCKISGTVTEADPTGWTPGDIRPYLDTVMDAFGPDRLMFGSDWPVCLLASSYERTYNLAASFVSTLSSDEQAAVMGLNAARFYKLAGSP